MNCSNDKNASLSNPNNMRFISLISLITILAPFAQGVAVHQDKTFALTPDEWKARWDAWPTRTEAELKKRMLSRREDVLGLHNDTTLITPGEVCERITGCIGSAAATAADWTAAAGYATAAVCSNAANYAANAFSANNYALAKQTANYIITEIAVPLLNTIPQYYINLALQNDGPQSHDDKCGTSQAQAIAEQAGTVTYTWCLQLQEITKSEAFSRADFGTVSSDNSNDDVGLDLKSRLFLSRTQGMFAQACQLLGVYLRF